MAKSQRNDMVVIVLHLSRMNELVSFFRHLGFSVIKHSIRGSRG